ncbi:MAG: PH domain-containing protein [Candidatus Kerfeldbacteria bacterium]|nr:PH domain-containing protein [Candidatus Kerfeldbacteria bacterium]
MRRFHDQEPNESVVLLLRRHWSVPLRTLLFFLVLGGLPVGILLVISSFVTVEFTSGSFFYIFLVFIVSLYELLLWFLLFHAWLDYYLDAWIVTDQRIVSIEHHGLLSRTVSEQKLERVQDITAETSGALATFLGYGDVHIQSAGAEQRFIFEQVPHPDAVVRQIHELHDAVVARTPQPVVMTAPPGSPSTPAAPGQGTPTPPSVLPVSPPQTAIPPSPPPQKPPTVSSQPR